MKGTPQDGGEGNEDPRLYHHQPKQEQARGLSGRYLKKMKLNALFHASGDIMSRSGELTEDLELK